MPVPTETRAPRPLLRDEVLARVRAAIVDGTLEPGEQLRDGDVAAWLGVSRTPVREALLELGRAGLVRALPGRSTVVAPLEERAIRVAQVVVAAMHRLVVQQAACLMTDADIQRMRAANLRFAAAQEAGDADAALAADEEFHAVALDVSGNSVARAVIAQYEPVLHRAERLRFASIEGRDSVLRHERLIELCAAGDAEAAASVAEHTWQSLTVEAHDSPDTRPPDEETA